MCEDAYYKKVNQNSFKKNNKRSKRCVITKEEKKKPCIQSHNKLTFNKYTHNAVSHRNPQTPQKHFIHAHDHSDSQHSCLDERKKKKKHCTSLVFGVEEEKEKER